jgi:membrane protein DedA with SNARE-associated domain
VSPNDILQWVDHSPALQAAFLFLLPFIHEDVAIAVGTLLLQDSAVSSTVVVPSLFSGMVASDVAFYGLGVFAAQLPWTHRLMARPGLQAVAGMLEKRILETMLVVRLVPGLLMPCFMTFGARRFCFRSFLGASSVFSTVYLIVVLGTALFVCRHWSAVTEGSMMLLAVPVALIVLYGLRWIASLAAPRLLARASGGPAGATMPLSEECAPQVLPPPTVASFPRPVAKAERIPPLVFYAPLALNWLRLGIVHRSFSLPTAANPRITTGGMWGEAKSEYFAEAGNLARSFITPTAEIMRPEGPATGWLDETLEQLAADDLTCPVVLKPDVGWQGYGVRCIDTEVELRRALAGLPAGVPFLVQELSPYAGEAGLLYARMPGFPRGRILSLAIRHHPAVRGDGRSTVRELIAADPRLTWKSACYLAHGPAHRGLGDELLASVPPAGSVVTLSFIGSQRVGGFYRDGASLITRALEERIDAIAQDIADFHYGRFDIRFESANSLARGENFQIIEINGIGGEAIHVWDPAFALTDVYRELFHQQALLFEIGQRQRRRGVQPCGSLALALAAARQSKLIDRYPASE